MTAVKTRRKNSRQEAEKNNNKKPLVIIAVIAVALSAFLFTLLSKMLIPEQVITFDQTNKTFVVKGDVNIRKAKGEAPWQRMSTPTILEKGDIIETAADSSVDLIIGSNVDRLVRVGENSRAEFEGVNPTHINLSKGKAIAAIKRLEPRSSFTVKTPTALCGVRGTEWSIETIADRTKVCVFEGQIYAREIGVNGMPRLKRHAVDAGTQRILAKGMPIGEAQKIEEEDLADWKYWDKNTTFLREGKILVNDFDKKENLNNLGGSFGSWVVFYSDTNQHCRDEFCTTERMGDKGFSLKLDYDVDSPYSAYNGFFTKLMGIDITGYRYIVFSIKGDKTAGFTAKLDVELKNESQKGKTSVSGITDEWQRMALPLESFKGITDFTNMKEMVVVFSDLNTTKKEGIIYIDDIYFAKTRPT